MRVWFLSLLLCPMAFAGDWVVPWITHNGQFKSDIIWTNPTAEALVLNLVAKRNGGETFEAQVTLDPLAQRVAAVNELFPQLEEGAGFALYMNSESDALLGSYMVVGTQSASGSSPAQGNIQLQSTAGRHLIFPFLPDPASQISAPVVVNLGTDTANLVMTAYQDSAILGQREHTLAVGEPFAAVSSDLFPDLSGPIYLHVQADQPLAGTSFAFNELLEPSVSEALVVAQGPEELVDQVAGSVTTVTMDSDLRIDGFTMGPDGMMYAAEGWAGNRVFRISLEGVVETYASGLRGPIDMAFDRFGNMIVTETVGSLARVAPDGTVERLAFILSGPNGVAVGPDGNYYVTYYGVNGSGRQIDRVTPDGEVSTFAEGGSIRTPIGIAFDDAGMMYSTNFEDGVVNKIDSNGQVSVLATIPNTLLGYVRVVGAYLYISSHTHNVLYRVHKETGAWEIVAGTGAANDSDGQLLQASFAGTWGLAVSEDNRDIYVTAYRDNVASASAIVRHVRLD
ncbi:SMP-30/gluconolactonase/LRE family protein [Sulfidibacter corallicola]|uniref:SMP-30/gluconolactonase/LRE family protein n=1 Tax=Sulfidibacter corallicola TaxID=2818388 RepID=A0A8A4THV1_SULCO|nr:SMP-30/gluconolactonase/LRE family protein [Sulfidibacter corallicola]QTD48774.1 SMP-30/gluconolactonase/LRE family protein [Sulfidibacter corallicola]